MLLLQDDANCRADLQRYRKAQPSCGEGKWRVQLPTNSVAATYAMLHACRMFLYRSSTAGTLRLSSSPMTSNTCLGKVWQCKTRRNNMKRVRSGE